MKNSLFLTSLAALTAAALASSAEISVVVDHKENGDANSSFDFKRVPPPTKAGTAGKFTIVDGDIDGNGGGIEKLTDGKLPTEEDQPAENAFFNAGTPGGRLRLDLEQVKSIQQINTYSWHPNTRGPQVYKVYGASGTGPGFNAEPKRGTDPASCGWMLIASVDTRPKDGEPGGQYGVSIKNASGAIGDYRYLLFDCKSTESDDDFGNTFYSEINVVSDAGALSPGNHEISVVVDHKENGDPSPAFEFKHVPSPAKVGTAGVFSVVNGELDGNGGGIEMLNDGKLPAEEDQPAENAFFNAGTPGGRLLLDLHKVKPIQQINTYSWHPNTRAPQVYKVYGATGTADGFSAEPKSDKDPTTCGWTFISSVDTRPKDGEPGGQYGVSIHASGGNIGEYRYILFDCKPTESDDGFGNTFYSEINVLAPGETSANPGGAPSGDNSDKKTLNIVHTADGKYEIDFDTSRQPDLTEWATNKLAPVLLEWYPKIVSYFPSEGYEAPAKFTVVIRPGNGVADTSGTRINAYTAWIKREMRGQAIGSVIHECVHVVQQYGYARRHNPHPSENPGYFTEGIADYYRFYLYEPQAKGAEIRRRGLERANYDRSYRVTANFLNWVSEKYDKNFVPKLNAAMREGNYNAELWTKNTGKSIDELNTEWKADLKAKIDASSGNT